MYQIISKGGFIMTLIIGCSVISLAIIIERFIYLVKRKKSVADFDKKINSLVQGNLKPEEIDSKAGRIASRYVRESERNLTGLTIIATISPLLGLLGTVIGMIKAFMKIQQLSGQVDSNILAGGIWEALLTTAAGLSVAIPTLIMYHYFEKKSDDFANELNETAISIIESKE